MSPEQTRCTYHSFSLLREFDHFVWLFLLFVLDRVHIEAGLCERLVRLRGLLAAAKIARQRQLNCRLAIFLTFSSEMLSLAAYLRES